MDFYIVYKKNIFILLLIFQNVSYATSITDVEKIDRLILENIRLNERLNKLEKIENSRKKNSEYDTEIHGYIKTDILFDIKGKSGDRINYTTIPIDGSVDANNTGHFRMHAKESRLNLTSNRLTQYGSLRLFLEVDFYGDGTNSPPGSELISNAVKPRLRHAFFQFGSSRAGKILVGQAWSNFVDVKSFPESLDLSNDTGQAFLFQPQIRFSKKISHVTTSFSVENPESDITFVPVSTTVLTPVSIPVCDRGKDSLPDFTMKVLYKKNDSHLSLQSVLREIKARCNNTSRSQRGFGLGMSGRFHIAESNILRFHFSHGKGIGRYIQEASNSAAISSASYLTTQAAWGGYIGFQHKWNSVLRSNINAGIAAIDWDDFLTDKSVVERYQSAHVNFIWRWFENSDLGIEYSVAEVERLSKKSGRINRIQMSMKYLF